jgi:hypothetical protein
VWVSENRRGGFEVPGLDYPLPALATSEAVADRRPTTPKPVRDDNITIVLLQGDEGPPYGLAFDLADRMLFCVAWEREAARKWAGLELDVPQ